MNKLLAVLIAAMFGAVSINAFAAKHMGAEKKGPSAEQCKKDPKMKGCEEKKKK